MAHNLGALRMDPGEIDQVVISHGHPDHFGGIYALLGGVETPLPVVTHPDAFLPRYAVMGDSRAAPFYNHEFREDLISGNGGGRGQQGPDGLRPWRLHDRRDTA